MLRDGSKEMHVYRLNDLALTISASHHTCHAFLDLTMETLSRRATFQSALPRHRRSLNEKQSVLSDRDLVCLLSFGLIKGVR